jgi:DNA repair exonuclease SbcCD nuclease subunit
MTIPSNKAAIVSDLHLGVHQNNEKWLKEVIKFGNWLRNDLLSRGIEDIIIPGDFFHDRTDINLLTLQYASDLLSIWKDFRIWIIPGNHDCYHKEDATISSISIMKNHTNVTLMSEVTQVFAGGKKLSFIPWGTKIVDVPKCDVVFGHFELNGFKMNSFKVCEGHDDSESLLDKTPLVITGHFHLRQEKRSKKGTVLYVGTPYEMDYNDMGSDKGYHIIHFNYAGNEVGVVDREETKVEFIKYTETTKHQKIALSDLINNKDNLTTYLRDRVQGNVVTFIVDKEVDFDKINALTQKILAFEPLAFRGTELTFKKDESDLQIENVQVNIQIEELIAEFVKKLELENSEEVLKLVLELYSKYKVA